MCYIRSELSEGMSPIDHLSPQEDRIWLRLNVAFFGFPRDVLICFAYVTPESSCHQSSRNNLWITLQEEIALLSHEGDLILTGDFNARTGEEQDFIPNDSESYIPLPPDYQVDHCPSRFSQDKKLTTMEKNYLASAKVVDRECSTEELETSQLVPLDPSRTTALELWP